MAVKVTSNKAAFLTASNNAVRAALVAIGAQAEGKAKVELSNTPKRIDTGLLRNSITHALSGESPVISAYRGDNPPRENPNGPIPEGNYAGQAPKARAHEESVWIGTNVEYAIYVHEGTSKMVANRFLRNAVTRGAKEYKEIAKKFLEGG